MIEILHIRGSQDDDNGSNVQRRAGSSSTREVWIRCGDQSAPVFMLTRTTAATYRTHGTLDSSARESRDSRLLSTLHAWATCACRSRACCGWSRWCSSAAPGARRQSPRRPQPTPHTHFQTRKPQQFVSTTQAPHPDTRNGTRPRRRATGAATHLLARRRESDTLRIRL